MAYLQQNIQTLLGQSDITWRQGATLAQPILLGPKDGANICTPNAAIENYILNGATNLSLKWFPVVGADYYVIQLCNNSSFNGPTNQGYKVAAPTTSYPLNFVTNVDLSRQTYWRVMAFSSTGDVSPKSNTWSFTFDCGDLGGNPENKDISCEFYNVKIPIFGPDVVKGDSQQALYHANVEWDCKGEESSGDYAGEISLISVVWSIEQSSRNPVAIACQNSNFAVLDIQSTTSEMFTVKVCATFRVVGSGYEFECCNHKDVTIDAFTNSITDIRHARVLCAYDNDTYLVGIVERVFTGTYGATCEPDDPDYESDEAICITEAGDNWLNHEFDWVESAEPTKEVFCTDILQKVMRHGRTQYPVGTDLIIGRIRQPVPEGSSSSSSSSGDCTNTNQDSWWILRADYSEFAMLVVKSSNNVNQHGSGYFSVHGGAQVPAMDDDNCFGRVFGYCRLGSYLANTWAYAFLVNGSWEIIAAECSPVSSSS